MKTFREFRKISNGEVNPLQNIEIQIDNLFDELKKKIRNPENSRSKWMNEYHKWVDTAKREYKWNSLYEYNEIKNFTNQFQEALNTITTTSSNYSIISEYKIKMKQMVRGFMPSVVIENYDQNVSAVLEKYDVPLEMLIEWYKEDGHKFNAEELEQIIEGICETIWSDMGHGALKGAGIGAGTGAVSGSLFGGFPGAGIGAGIGGLVGGAAGGLYGLGRGLWNKWKNRNQPVKPDYQGLLAQLKNDNKDNPEIVNAVNKLVNTLANANNTSTTAPPITSDKPTVAAPVVPTPIPAPAKKEEPILAPAPKKEEPIPAPKKEEPIPAPKKEEPIPAPKKEEPIPAPKKEEPIPAPAPKKEEPIPAPAKKEEPIPAPKKEEPIPAPKKEEPIPAPKKEEPSNEEAELIKLGRAILLARDFYDKQDVTTSEIEAFKGLKGNHQHKKDEYIAAAKEYQSQNKKPQEADNPPVVSGPNQGIQPPKEEELPSKGNIAGAPPPVDMETAKPSAIELRRWPEEKFKQWVLENDPEGIPVIFNGEEWWVKRPSMRKKAIAELINGAKIDDPPMPPPPSEMAGRPSDSQLMMMKPSQFRNFVLANEPDLAYSYEGQPWDTHKFRMELIATLKHLWKDKDGKEAEMAKQQNENPDQWHNESLQYKVKKYKEMLQNGTKPEITLYEVAGLSLSERVKFYRDRLSCRDRFSTT